MTSPYFVNWSGNNLIRRQGCDVHSYFVRNANDLCLALLHLDFGKHSFKNRFEQTINIEMFLAKGMLGLGGTSLPLPMVETCIGGPSETSTSECRVLATALEGALAWTGSAFAMSNTPGTTAKSFLASMWWEITFKPEDVWYSSTDRFLLRMKSFPYTTHFLSSHTSGTHLAHPHSCPTGPTSRVASCLQVVPRSLRSLWLQPSRATTREVSPQCPWTRGVPSSCCSRQLLGVQLPTGWRDRETCVPLPIPGCITSSCSTLSTEVRRFQECTCEQQIFYLLLIF